MLMRRIALLTTSLLACGARSPGPLDPPRRAPTPLYDERARGEVSVSLFHDDGEYVAGRVPPELPRAIRTSCVEGRALSPSWIMFSIASHDEGRANLVESSEPVDRGLVPCVRERLTTLKLSEDLSGRPRVLVYVTIR